MPESNLLQRQQAVLNLLSQFKGVEPLKKLFWSELNYDRVNQSLSRRGWTEGVAQLLADDPVLLASGADNFHVIYGRLKSDKLLMGDERPVVNKLLQEHPYVLFVFSNSKQEHFHFLNVKYDDDVQKRRMFRRITVGPNERLRTASERIALLDLADISPNLFGLSPLAVQQRHDAAFDVEPVTKEFFSEYRRIFEEVEEAITGFGRDKDRKRLYTQRLFNRLMFIAFIQKKGWLKLNGNADYLAALWKAHLKDTSVADKNFYRDRLKALFFFGLNSSNEVNQIGINKGGFLKSLIGDVPYLNGGLFEEEEEDKNEEIRVQDKAITAVLNGLFAKFNFTVTESTPLDVEVAVDPEMLGKIFEELVTGRHETGSYYTPKPVVSFMCREALKSYLADNGPTETPQAIERFVERHEPDDLKNPENILNALTKVRVCDPACGSGAYLLGMLHELLDLRAALFQSRRLDAKSVYERKLEIIQSNLYGVDLDPFAVNIARLRLWLSLSVDFDGARPEPLPNLDYKVERGDSLIGPNPSGGIEMGFRKQLIDEFLGAKAQFLTAHDTQKKALKKKVEQLRADILTFSGHKQLQGFDWAVEFAEVFIEGGFDIVVANPPYGDIAPAESRPALRRNFPFIADMDVAQAFIAAGEHLLRDKGTLAYIVSNTVLLNVGATAFRKNALASQTPLFIVDLSTIQVFENPVVRNIILTVKKCPPAAKHTFTTAKCTKLEYSEIQLNTDVVLHERFCKDDSEWTRAFLQQGRASDLLANIKAKADGPLSQWFDVSQGLIPYDKYRGHSEATIKNRIWHSDHKVDKTYRRELKGGDVKRYQIAWNGSLWISYGDWLAAPRDPKFFRRPRVLIREITDQKTGALFCAYTEDEYYNTPSIINVIQRDGLNISLRYLSAILNSRLFALYHLLNSPKARKGLFPKILVKDVRELPLRVSAKHERALEKKVAELENAIAECATAKVSRLESEIESLVLDLFEVSPDEVAAAEAEID